MYYFLFTGSACRLASLPTVTEQATQTAVESPTATQPDPATSTPAPTPQPTTTPTSEAAPEIGSITFALDVTDEHEPINPATSFEEGLVEIHAVFDYSHMSKEYIWERVWYHDGEEKLSNAEKWAGDESGRFDYFLDTGSQPLPPGQWLLELYVEGELKATGQFTVNTKVAIAKPTPEPTVEPAAEPTEEATNEPPPPTPTPRPYHLTYSKWDGGSHSVYIADINGQNEQLIFTRAAGPSFSPDKKRLFFFGEQGVNQQIRENRVVCEFGTISGGIVAVDLMDASGNFVAHSLTIENINPGPGILTLRFAGDDIYASGRNGPYTLTNLLLTDQRNTTLAVVEAMNVYTTAAYDYRNFVTTSIYLPIIVK